MQTKIYVAGNYVKTGNILNVYNPFDQSLVAQTFYGSHENLEEAVSKAISVQEVLKELPSWKKYNILSDIAAGISSKKDHFTEILCRESGKPWKYAAGEVSRAIQTFIVAAEESKRLPKEYIDIDWTEAGKGKEGFVRYFPVGLVAGISPFNFPLNLAVHKIAPAIAAGCPIILKPSSNTPLSTLELAKIIGKTELPQGAVSIIPMDRITGNLLVTDDRFKLLTFTGSPEVGWKMKNDAGKKKVILELGGNAGVIVSVSANIDHAVQRCVTGGFAYSGQVCIHTQRIYVEESVFTEFIGKFVEKVKALKYGDPIDPQTDISVMIDEQNAIRVQEWIGEAVENGAELIYGGKRNGTYIEPAILTRTKPEMKVCAMEVFGPVVTLEKFKSFPDVVSAVNQGKYGLQAGVFTDSIDEMNYAFNHLDVGGVIINDVPTFRVDHMPYGGIKDSGLGREGVKYAIHDMLEARILVKNK
ncbi:MAG: aldehyde dehydrogenase family protein [Bacteroidetes bacterium]|nr:aldehyde dehydrogenase family protein [Bacteroidota bacterium]